MLHSSTSNQFGRFMHTSLSANNPKRAEATLAPDICDGGGRELAPLSGRGPSRRQVEVTKGMTGSTPAVYASITVNENPTTSGCELNRMTGTRGAPTGMSLNSKHD